MKDVLGEISFRENIKRKNSELIVKVFDCELCWQLGWVGTEGGVQAPS